MNGAARGMLGDAQAHNAMGTAYRQLGNLDMALACYERALACDPRHAPTLGNIGDIFRELGDFTEALRWYRAARGELSYVHPRVLVHTAPNPKRTVLVLWSAGPGNIPVQHLLPDDTVTRIDCVIEYATEEDFAGLPDYNLVFNAIGDSDVMGVVALPMRKFLGACAKPFLNDPAAVASTARSAIPALLADVDGVLVPATTRHDKADVKQALHAIPEASFPVLLRPVHSHGGDHLAKIESKSGIDTLEIRPADQHYLTEYRDYRSADGNFRKYRILFIDRVPYPYHLAIGGHWIVHHYTAGMENEDWKRAEEAAFLADPAGTIGRRAMAAIAEIGRRLDLDYGGIDFSILPDGRVLVFEANATMLVHPEDEDGIFAYKNPYVRRILDAFDAMLEQRLNSADAL